MNLLGQKEKSSDLVVFSTRIPKKIIEGKGDIVSFNNPTKSGVDTLDKIVRSDLSKRRCRRWPYTFFFSMLDVAAYAAFCLMKDTTGATDSHYTFKQELVSEMTILHVKLRHHHFQI